MFEFIKNTSIVSGISKGFSSMTGYIKSIDYKSKLDNTRTIVSGLFTYKDESENTVLPMQDVNGCVGKLPVYADFLRINLYSEEALLLDKWIQSGFGHLSQKRMETFKQVFNRFPDLRFILFGDNHLKAVAGVMVAGQDQSGREYPFVIFKVVGQHYSQDQISLLPLLVDQFCQSALTLCHEDWSNKSKDILGEQVEQLPKNEFRSGIDTLQKNSANLLDLHSTEAFWQVLLPDGEIESRAEFIQIFNRKVQEIHSLTPAATDWGIEISLHDYSKAILIQQFFVSLLEQMLIHCTWRGQCWLAETNEGEGRLIIFLRPVRTEDLLTLVDQESGRTNLYIIAELLNESEGELKEELKVLDSGQLILATMAEQWVNIHTSWFNGLKKEKD